MAEQEKAPEEIEEPKNEDNPVDDPGDDPDDPVEKALADIPEGTTKKTAEDLRRELRESDRVRKREAAKKDKELADLRAKLKEIEDATASETEKAINAAREEGRNSALSEVQKELRAERLASAVTRMASKGIKVGDGDDAETVKFADRPTRVMLEQALVNEDIDSGDVFDDRGRVREDGLREAVAQLLADEEHLIVRPPANGGEKQRPPANDAGKGSGAGAKSLEEMSPDDHLKEIQGRR